LYFHQTAVIYGFTGKSKNKEPEEERLDTKANYYKNKAQYNRRLIKWLNYKLSKSMNFEQMKMKQEFPNSHDKNFVFAKLQGDLTGGS
jgi:hypothetical protein